MIKKFTRRECALQSAVPATADHFLTRARMAPGRSPQARPHGLQTASPGPIAERGTSRGEELGTGAFWHGNARRWHGGSTRFPAQRASTQYLRVPVRRSCSLSVTFSFLHPLHASSYRFRWVRFADSRLVRSAMNALSAHSPLFFTSVRLPDHE